MDFNDKLVIVVMSFDDVNESAESSPRPRVDIEIDDVIVINTQQWF